MAVKKLNSYLYNLIAVSVLGSGSLIYFWLNEPNRFIAWVVILLVILAIWQFTKKDTDSILFLTCFLFSTGLFTASNNFLIPIEITGLILFLIITFLYNFRYSKSVVKGYRYFSAYSTLLGLLVVELTYILAFFPVEAKNKAIIITILFWGYDECIENYEAGTLSRKTAIAFSAVLTIIFLLLTLSFPFQTGL